MLRGEAGGPFGRGGTTQPLGKRAEAAGGGMSRSSNGMSPGSIAGKPSLREPQ